MKSDLTQRQEAFIAAYIETGNATEAYRRAYPASRKWRTANAVESCASTMLASPKVSQRVDVLRKKAESAAVATRQEVLEVLSRVIRACPADILDEGGYVDLDRLRAMRQEVQEVTVDVAPNGARRYRVKLRDAIAAADRIAKLQGWDAATKVDHTTNGKPLPSGPVVIQFVGGDGD